MKKLTENQKIVLDFNTQSEPESLAYVIGFIWADGTVNLGKYIVVEINHEDANDIKHIFDNVCDFKLSERMRPGRQKQITFFINDPDFANLLKDLGKYPHSTENHEKVLNYIPEKFHTYFLRGLIDGDGCFYGARPNKKWNNIAMQFSIAGSFEQEWDSIVMLLEKIGCHPVIKRRTGKKSKNSIVLLTLAKDIENLCNSLYSIDDNLYLTRKHDKALALINEHKRCKKESIERRQKYEITLGNGEKIIVNNLKSFSREYGYCYDNVVRLANKKLKKYKDLRIDKLMEEQGYRA